MLIVTLIALIIVIVGALAMMRSADTSSVIAGNIAFKRDLTNNAERAAQAAIAAFATGSLSTVTATYSNLQTANYSAVQLATNSTNRGIPNALLDDSVFASVGTSSNDISSNGVVIRYVIDRMCSQTGIPTSATCVLETENKDKGGTSWLQKAGGGYLPVYRISVRVTGPRNTQAFIQTTLAD